MKNLSLETCIRLKNAGFPQPERAPAQLWYCRGDLCVLYRVIPDGILAASLEGPAHYGATNSEDWVYCPTALELLSQTPGLAMMRVSDGWIFSMPKTFKQLSAQFSDDGVVEFLAGFFLENRNPL